MKLIVKKRFRDKEDHVTVYEPESILEVNDKERAADLVERGLCSEYKGKKVALVALGEKAPAEGTPVKETPEAPAEETPVKETPETPVKETPEAPAEETPVKETPETPVKETPEAPAEETPETPVKETPEAPAEETSKAAEKTSKSKVTKK